MNNPDPKLREQKLRGKVIMWHLRFDDGDRELYMYGATNDSGRKVYAAYALLWRAITEARPRCHVCISQ